jgi:hypothetical protein
MRIWDVFRFLELAVLRGFLAPIFGISPVLALCLTLGYFLNIFLLSTFDLFLTTSRMSI